MSAHSYARGWPVTYVSGVWIYDDTGEPIDEMRACARCGRVPTPEGYDACLGHIPGAIGACCGHGAENGYVKFPEEA